MSLLPSVHESLKLLGTCQIITPTPVRNVNYLAIWLKEAAEMQTSQINSRTKGKKRLKNIPDCYYYRRRTNPLEWWKVHQVVHPTTSKLAKRYVSYYLCK